MTFPYGFDNENIKKKRQSHVQFMLSDIILARWRRPVASSEALDLLHQVMHAVTYRRIATAIKTASFLSVFVDCCLFACCPGNCWGNTEWVVARCRCPVASGVALDMPHWLINKLLIELPLILLFSNYDRWQSFWLPCLTTARPHQSDWVGHPGGCPTPLVSMQKRPELFWKASNLSM